MDYENKLKTEFSDDIIDYHSDNYHRFYFTVNPDSLLDIASFVEHELGFTIPNFCVGTDLKDKMEVSWVIGNSKNADLIILRVHTDRDDPEVPSLSNLWKGMNWHERETYDLVGIKFKGHPDLRRILMPENWEGYPLREDYVYKKPIYRKPEDE